MFKKEVERLVLLGFLEVSNDSDWGAPSFAKNKLKSNWVCFVRDFRNLNKQLKRKSYDGFQAKTSNFSTRHLILVNYKV